MRVLSNEHLFWFKTGDEWNRYIWFNCIAPDGCYVAFTNITETKKTSQEIYDLLLQEAKVAVVPVKTMVWRRCRRSYSNEFTSEEVIYEAMDR
jgi:aspartate/methionine/tyrosine aminotransferase